MVTPPSLLGALLDEGDRGGGWARDMWRSGPLSLVICSGGGTPPLGLVRRFLAATHGRVRLVHLYGSAETCGGAMLAHVTEAMLAAPRLTASHGESKGAGFRPCWRVNAGRPLLVSAVCVLDEAGQVAARGALGELAREGGKANGKEKERKPQDFNEELKEEVMKGLTEESKSGLKEELKDKDMEQVLVDGDGADVYGTSGALYDKADDLHSNTSNDPRRVLLYRTGDAARLLMPSGEIELMGRLDRCVHMHGAQVELAWVEGVLASIPGVAACAVVLVRVPGEDAVADGGGYDVAYVGGHDVAYGAGDGGADAGGYGNEAGSEVLVGVVAPRTLLPVIILAMMRRELPPYAVPGHIVCVDQLPALTGGELDRRQLTRVAAAELHRWQQGSDGRGRTAGAKLGGGMRTGALSPKEPPRGPAGTDVGGRAAVLPAVSLADDFFHLGGDSLTAMRLSSEIQRSPEFARLLSGVGTTARRQLSVSRHRTVRNMAAAFAGASRQCVTRVTPGDLPGSCCKEATVTSSRSLSRDAGGDAPALTDATPALSQPSSGKSSGAGSALASDASPTLATATDEVTAGRAQADDPPPQQPAGLDAARSNLCFLWTFSLAMLHFGGCVPGQNLRCLQHTELASRWGPFDGDWRANVAPLLFRGAVTGLTLLSGMGLAASPTGPWLQRVILVASLALAMQYGVCAGFDAFHNDSSERDPLPTTSHLWALWAFVFNHLLAWVCLGGGQLSGSIGGGQRWRSRLAFFLLASTTIHFLLPILLAVLSPPSAAVSSVGGMWFGPWGIHQLSWNPLLPRVLSTVFPFATGVVSERAITRQVARARSLP
eukprot:jgi/Mesvir1/24773/Mv22028-RA.1